MPNGGWPERGRLSGGLESEPQMDGHYSTSVSQGGMLPSPGLRSFGAEAKRPTREAGECTTHEAMCGPSEQSQGVKFRGSSHRRFRCLHRYMVESGLCYCLPVIAARVRIAL